MNCGFCEHTDGLIYTSNPPKVRCNFTGEYHDTRDDCNVELVPVRHGMWLDVQPAPWGQVYETCSVCGVRQANDKVMDNFCGVCGAKMTEGESNEL